MNEARSRTTHASCNEPSASIVASTPNAAFDPHRYTRELAQNWGDVARPFAKISSGYFAEATAPFFDFAGLVPGQRVLDVACGPGTSTYLAAAKVLPGGSVLGADVSPPMLDVARRNLRASLASCVEFRLLNAEALDLPDQSFGAVTCHLGLMLFARPALALSEMTRVLEPGGTLACLVLGPADKMVFTSLLTRILPRHVPSHAASGAPELGSFASPHRLEEALSTAGLTAIRSQCLRGVFRVPTPKHYWDIVVKGFGKLGPIVRSLPDATRRAVRAEMTRELSAYAVGSELAIPYEFVMARGCCGTAYG